MWFCVLWDKWCNMFLPLVSRRQRICTGLSWREVGLPHSRFDLCPVNHWDRDPTLPPHIPSTTPEPHRRTIATANQVGGSITAKYSIMYRAPQFALSYRYDCLLKIKLIINFAIRLWFLRRWVKEQSADDVRMGQDIGRNMQQGNEQLKK